MRDLVRAQLAHQLDPLVGHLLDRRAVLPLDGLAEPDAERLPLDPFHGQDRQPLAVDLDALGIVLKSDRALRLLLRKVLVDHLVARLAIGLGRVHEHPHGGRPEPF